MRNPRKVCQVRAVAIASTIAVSVRELVLALSRTTPLCLCDDRKNWRQALQQTQNILVDSAHFCLPARLHLGLELAHQSVQLADEPWGGFGMGNVPGRYPLVKLALVGLHAVY